MNMEQIITIVATVLGASGLFKGVEIYIGRRRSNGVPGSPTSIGTTSPGIVTETYCKDTRKEMLERTEERDGELKISIDKLTEKVDDLGQKFAGVEATAIKASNRSVKEHEGRFHKGRST